MSVTVIDNFEFDVDILIDEYKTFIADQVESYLYNAEAFSSTKFTIVSNYKAHDILEKMPQTQEIINRMKQMGDFSEVTYRVVLPSREYNWHIDHWSLINHNYHIPLITNQGCNFVYLDAMYTMPIGKLYKAMIYELHTFRNNGIEPRVHLMFEKQEHL